MSKRQEKIAGRKEEQAAFLTARRQDNMAKFAARVEMGKMLLNDNRDKIPAEELALLEAELAQNEKIIADYLEEIKNAESTQEA
jgi:hypothetical protein